MPFSVAGHSRSKWGTFSDSSCYRKLVNLAEGSSMLHQVLLQFVSTHGFEAHPYTDKTWSPDWVGLWEISISIFQGSLWCCIGQELGFPVTLNRDFVMGLWRLNGFMLWLLFLLYCARIEKLLLLGIFLKWHLLVNCFTFWSPCSYVYWNDTALERAKWLSLGSRNSNHTDSQVRLIFAI